jgi:hypothetical protein
VATDPYDRDVRELAREKLSELRAFAEKHRHRLPNWSARTWTLAGLGLVVAVYALAFASQSISAEHSCLRERHAASFYVSPWTLTTYCTFHTGGREITLEAED